jgi:hypothetical protein
MIDKTLNEIRDAFFKSASKRWLADPRTEVLFAMVCDLLMEVEALRETLLRSNTGSGRKESAYARAYREIALLTHNSAGPSSGLDKLLARFYRPEAEMCSGRTCCSGWATHKTTFKLTKVKLRRQSYLHRNNVQGQWRFANDRPPFAPAG